MLNRSGGSRAERRAGAPLLLWGHRTLGDTHVFEGIYTPREAYTRATGDAGAFEELARILDERITPTYRGPADELGLGPEAFAGLTSKTEELRALQRQLGSTLTSGGRMSFTHYMEGTRAYLEVLGVNAEEVWRAG